MIYFSNTLFQHPAAFGVISSLDAHNIPYRFFFGTKDIWLRDFMPVRTGSGKLVSFRYEPSYLKNDPDLRTNFRRTWLHSSACRLHTAISTLTVGTWCSRRPGSAS